MFSSMTAPMMSWASSASVQRAMTSAAWYISSRVMSGPAVTFRSTRRAPSMGVSSSGLLTAISAASSARLSPPAWPMPMIALPASIMIAFTSAKSTLIMPGKVMMSETPCTPWRSTSSAIWNASSRVLRFPATLSRRSLGMVIIVSTRDRSWAMPSSARRRRRGPSKLNGLVTTPTVRAFISRAISAMRGAAPVPVPPPIPAVMNTISAPSSSFLIS